MSDSQQSQVKLTTEQLFQMESLRRELPKMEREALEKFALEMFCYIKLRDNCLVLLFKKDLGL